MKSSSKLVVRAAMASVAAVPAHPSKAHSRPPVLSIINPDMGPVSQNKENIYKEQGD